MPIRPSADSYDRAYHLQHLASYAEAVRVDARLMPLIKHFVRGVDLSTNGVLVVQTEGEW